MVDIDEILVCNLDYNFNEDLHLAVLKSYALESKLFPLISIIWNLQVDTQSVYIQTSDENYHYALDLVSKISERYETDRIGIFIKDLRNPNVEELVTKWLYYNPKIKFTDIIPWSINSLEYRLKTAPEVYNTRIGYTLVKDIIRTLMNNPFMYQANEAVYLTKSVDPTYNLNDVLEECIQKNIIARSLAYTKEFSAFSDLYSNKAYSIQDEFEAISLYKILPNESEIIVQDFKTFNIEDSMKRFYQLQVLNNPYRVF
ncbi:hypothetical protein D3C87_920450 [compost metagenome]